MKDMRRINKIYPIHKNPHGYYDIFCEIGSGKNNYVLTLAAADNEAEIIRKYNAITQIVGSYKAPIAETVIPEILVAIRKINEELHPRRFN